MSPTCADVLVSTIYGGTSEAMKATARKIDQAVAAATVANRHVELGET